MPTAKLEGTELHYRDAGAGHRDPVVFLHAFPLHSGMWSKQMAALEKKYRVIAPDYRGLGKSGPPVAEASTMDLLAGDVRALLEHLRVSRAVFVGCSMGGYLSFELYRQAPALFRGLVLCDSKATADTDEGKANRETFARTTLEKGLGWVTEQMTPKLLRPHPAPAAVKEVRELIAGGSPTGVAAAQRGMARRPDSIPTLARIACPTLVIVGEEDGLTPPSDSEKMVAGVKGAKLVRVKGAGHLANIEQHEAVDAALLDFLATLPA